MDKLRALQYFACAAAENSLSAAARRFEVSVTAVAKMITVLEQSVGVRLLERSAQGITLTASGAQYLEACLPALTQLGDGGRHAEGVHLAHARAPSWSACST